QAAVQGSVDQVIRVDLFHPRQFQEASYFLRVNGYSQAVEDNLIPVIYPGAGGLLGEILDKALLLAGQVVEISCTGCPGYGKFGGAGCGWIGGLQPGHPATVG